MHLLLLLGVYSNALPLPLYLPTNAMKMGTAWDSASVLPGQLEAPLPPWS